MKVYSVLFLHGCSLGLVELIKFFVFRIHCVEVLVLESSITVFYFGLKLSNPYRSAAANNGETDRDWARFCVAQFCGGP